MISALHGIHGSNDIGEQSSLDQYSFLPSMHNSESELPPHCAGSAIHWNEDFSLAPGSLDSVFDIFGDLNPFDLSQFNLVG